LVDLGGLPGNLSIPGDANCYGACVVSLLWRRACQVKVSQVSMTTRVGSTVVPLALLSPNNKRELVWLSGDLSIPGDVSGGGACVFPLLWRRVCQVKVSRLSMTTRVGGTVIPLALLSPFNNESCCWGALPDFVAQLARSRCTDNNKELTTILAHDYPWREYLTLGLWV